MCVFIVYVFRVFCLVYFIFYFFVCFCCLGVGFGLFLCFRGMVECEWRGIVYIWVFLYKEWSVGGVFRGFWVYFLGCGGGCV